MMMVINLENNTYMDVLQTAWNATVHTLNFEDFILALDELKENNPISKKISWIYFLKAEALMNINSNRKLIMNSYNEGVDVFHKENKWSQSYEKSLESIRRIKNKGL
jgi:hypothetical protein